MAGQRQLQQDAVDRIVGVELREQRLDLVLRRGRGQSIFEAFHARGDGRLALRPDIDRARRIVADQHDREAGRAARRAFKGWNRIGDPRPQAGGKRLAVDHLRSGHHAIPLA